jgi:hypothetical protein
MTTPPAPVEQPRRALSRQSLLDLQSSAGNAAVTAMLGASHAMAVQRTSLQDFTTSDPKHDPSRVTDAQIKGTDEFKAYMAKNPMPVPMRDIEPAEAMLACRLLLRDLRQAVVPFSIDDAMLMRWLDVARSRGAMTSTAEGAVGTQEWVQVTAEDVKKPGAADSDFTQWMLAGGTVPDPRTGKFNCWEMVLFSAYRCGALSEAALKGFYTRAKAQMKKTKDDMDFPRTLEKELRGSAVQTYDPKDKNSPRPLRGDLVIFDEAASHVALATGNRVGGAVEIVSHWPPPDGKHTVKRTTIEALLPEVGVTVAKFWGPSW